MFRSDNFLTLIDRYVTEREVHIALFRTEYYDTS